MFTVPKRISRTCEHGRTERDKTGRCLACARQRKKRNASVINAARREWRANNEQTRLTDRAWKQNNGRKIYGYHIKDRYGITLEQFDAMIIEQVGCCAICDKPMRRPNVDHCHFMKIIRGILCTSCNIAIGRLENYLIRATEYLHRRV